MTQLFQLLKDPKDRKVAIVGTGISGQSAARLLEKLCARVTTFDEKNGTPLSEKNTLCEFDLIVLSPGFPRSKAAILAALAKGTPIINEMDLAYAHLSDCRFIGVTGTNGKSTTTAMIGEILKTKDKGAFVGGNLGRPLCDAVLNGEKPFFGVVEISSFQLESLAALRLEVAVVTHLTPDHLDRYSNEQEYYRTKNKIFALLKSNGHAVINQKDPRSLQFLHPSQNRIEFNFPISISMPRLMGAHNLENAAAAIAATRALGFSQNEIEKALSNFEGMPHRLEYLGDIQDVGWFNDSKATNVESTITAVKSFENGIHLILGGLGKGASYAPLVENCRGRVKFVYVIGEDAPNIQNAFEEQFPVINAGTLERAVNEATQRASKGDVIVLAPACASYDQYPNYVARGNHFKQLFHDYQVKSHA